MKYAALRDLWMKVKSLQKWQTKGQVGRGVRPDGTTSAYNYCKAALLVHLTKAVY